MQKVGVEEAHPSSVEPVQVWVARLDAAASVLAALAASLSPAERARSERYRDSADARRFSAARGWLRHVLGAELGMAPKDVAFSDRPGKPRLADGNGPCFNLSRAAELALIAVAPSELGVDVEHASRAQHATDAARLACSPREAAALARLPPAARADTFLRWWTAKEAYLKATGLGLSFPPHEVEVGPDKARGAVPVLAGGRPSGWWVRPLRPAPGYVAAVAAQGRAWEIRMRALSPLTLTPP